MMACGFVYARGDSVKLESFNRFRHHHVKLNCHYMDMKSQLLYMNCVRSNNSEMETAASTVAHHHHPPAYIHVHLTN